MEKTYFLQFLTKNTNAIDLHISYENRQISSIHGTKFLGLVFHNNLSWHFHIDHMIPQLNKASYKNRSLKPLFSFESLKWFISQQSIQSYHMVSYSGVYQLIVKSYLKSKKE